MHSTPPEPLALSVEQAAHAVGLGRTKVYELLASGELPSVKVGKRRLVRVEALQRLLVAWERCRGTAAAPPQQAAAGACLIPDEPPSAPPEGSKTMRSSVVRPSGRERVRGDRT
jgi:excisionase family DNA binding protein